MVRLKANDVEAIDFDHLDFDEISEKIKCFLRDTLREEFSTLGAFQAGIAVLGGGCSEEFKGAEVWVDMLITDDGPARLFVLI